MMPYLLTSIGLLKMFELASATMKAPDGIAGSALYSVPKIVLFVVMCTYAGLADQEMASPVGM
jgi:hypothetical protein